jgi:hypothetical protein
MQMKKPVFTMSMNTSNQSKEGFKLKYEKMTQIIYYGVGYFSTDLYIDGYQREVIYHYYYPYLY